MAVRPFLACALLTACAFHPEPTGVAVRVDDVPDTGDGPDDDVLDDIGQIDTGRPTFDTAFDTAARASCTALRGRTFLSVEALECGLGPSGPVMCSWSVTFDPDHAFTWFFSDVGASGTWSCRGGLVLGDRGGDAPPIEGFFDRKSGQLTWDGVLYE